MRYKSVQKIFKEETEKARNAVNKANEEVLTLVRDDNKKRKIMKRRNGERETLVKRVNAVKRVFKSIEKQMQKEGLEVRFEWKYDMTFRMPVSKTLSFSSPYGIKKMTQGIKEHLLQAEIVAEMKDGAKDKLKLGVNIGVNKEQRINVEFNKNGTIKAKISEDIKRTILSEVATLQESRRIGLLTWQSKYRQKLLS